MSWVHRPILVLAVILGVIVAAPVGLIGAYLAYDVVARYLFFERHPMLKAMRDAPSVSFQSNDPWSQMTDILMKRVPPGSSRSEALRILSEENLACEKPRSKEDLIVCGPTSKPASIGGWYIELAFDDDRVSRGRVLRPK